MVTSCFDLAESRQIEQCVDQFGGENVESLTLS